MINKSSQCVAILYKEKIILLSLINRPQHFNLIYFKVYYLDVNNFSNVCIPFELHHPLSNLIIINITYRNNKYTYI